MRFVSLLLNSLLPKAQASEVCGQPLEYLRVESTESPFYVHYHQILIPVEVLIRKPAEGILVKSSSVDAGSYDPNEFKSFIQKSGLKESNLIAHAHDVLISQTQLIEISEGKSVEIRVISKSGNFVHNFIVQAPPSALSAIKRNS